MLKKIIYGLFILAGTSISIACFSQTFSLGKGLVISGKQSLFLQGLVDDTKGNIYVIGLEQPIFTYYYEEVTEENYTSTFYAFPIKKGNVKKPVKLEIPEGNYCIASNKSSHFLVPRSVYRDDHENPKIRVFNEDFSAVQTIEIPMENEYRHVYTEDAYCDQEGTLFLLMNYSSWNNRTRKNNTQCYLVRLDKNLQELKIEIIPDFSGTSIVPPSGNAFLKIQGKKDELDYAKKTYLEFPVDTSIRFADSTAFIYEGSYSYHRGNVIPSGYLMIEQSYTEDEMDPELVSKLHFMSPHTAGDTLWTKSILCPYIASATMVGNTENFIIINVSCGPEQSFYRVDEKGVQFLKRYDTQKWVKHAELYPSTTILKTRNKTWLLYQVDNPGLGKSMIGLLDYQIKP